MCGLSELVLHEYVGNMFEVLLIYLVLISVFTYNY